MLKIWCKIEKIILTELNEHDLCGQRFLDTFFFTFFISKSNREDHLNRVKWTDLCGQRLLDTFFPWIFDHLCYILRCFYIKSNLDLYFKTSKSNWEDHLNRVKWTDLCGQRFLDTLFFTFLSQNSRRSS